MAARPPPSLMDDLIIDILLRLTPDDIACLTRASLVCKAWRRLLADRAFLTRYRDIHGSPPFLGFLDNFYHVGGCRPLFIPTTPASPFSQSASAVTCTSCRTLDCRHGRVLLQPDLYPPSFIVWDPVTGKQRSFYAPLHQHPHVELMAAVLCASSNGCDHLDCGSGPFVVVLVEKSYRVNNIQWRLQEEMAQAILYSSETGKWSMSGSIDVWSLPWRTQSLLAGETVFFMAGVGQILKYELARGRLSVIRVPLELVANMNFCNAEDGAPGVAALEGYSLRLLSWRTKPDGVMEWAQGKVIELDSMIPTSSIGEPFTFSVVGFAEGTSYIFINANDSIFSLELKSGTITKICCGNFGSIIFPLMGFYIPDVAGANED